MRQIKPIEYGSAEYLETLELPDALFARLQDTERALREIS